MSLEGTVKHLNKRLSLMSRGMSNGTTAPCGKFAPQVQTHICCKKNFAASLTCYHCANRITRRAPWEGLDIQWRENQKTMRKYLAAQGSTADADSTAWHSDQDPIQEQEDDNGTGRRRKNRGPKRGSERPTRGRPRRV